MKRNRSQTVTSSTRAAYRAGLLIEAMLQEMQRGLACPETMETKHWLKLFGDRQSMVLNLQKLVQSSVMLQSVPAKKTNEMSDHQEDDAIPMQSLQMLAAWMNADELPAKD